MARNLKPVKGVRIGARSPEADVASCFRITSLFDTKKATDVLFVGPYDTKLYRKSLEKRLCLLAGIPLRGRSNIQSARLYEFRRLLNALPRQGKNRVDSAYLELPVEFDRWLTFVVDIAAPACSADTGVDGSDPVERLVFTFKRDYRDGVRFDPDTDNSLIGVKLGQGILQTVV